MSPKMPIGHYLLSPLSGLVKHKNIISNVFLNERIAIYQVYQKLSVIVKITL